MKSFLTLLAVLVCSWFMTSGAHAQDFINRKISFTITLSSAWSPEPVSVSKSITALAAFGKDGSFCAVKFDDQLVMPCTAKYLTAGVYMLVLNPTGAKLLLEELAMPAAVLEMLSIFKFSESSEFEFARVETRNPQAAKAGDLKLTVEADASRIYHVISTVLPQ